MEERRRVVGKALANRGDKERNQAKQANEASSMNERFSGINVYEWVFMNEWTNELMNE